MKLLIDIGNTRMKWALQSQLETLSEVQTASTHAPFTQAFKQAIAQATQIWVACVAGAEVRARLQAECASHQAVYWVTPNAVTLDLRNEYQPAESLGVDRWCNVLAVWQTHQQSALVVSLGTAVTIDALLVDDHKKASFLGGSIQPGLQLMLQSLHQGAAQLPHIESLPETLDGFAQHTQTAIAQGCVYAVVGAIVQQYQMLTQKVEENVARSSSASLSSSLSQPLLVLTGGDAKTVKAYLPKSLAQVTIFVDNLALAGLMVLAGTQ